MKYFQYIVLGLLVIIILQGFFTVQKGVSEEEVLYQLEIQRLNIEKTELLKKNSDLENKINYFKDEILQNDSITDNYTKPQLDSFLTNYFK
jgi:hypothetical protein